MFLVGIAYSSHHIVTELLLRKYKLHLFHLPQKKEIKGRKKKVDDSPSQEDKLQEVTNGLKEFLPGKDKLPKLLLVEKIEALLKIRKAFKLERNRRGIEGVLVFDSPSNLFDYSIPILDADRIKVGMWMKKKGFLEGGIFKDIKAHLRDNVSVAKVKPIKRKKISSWEEGSKEIKPTNKVRGFIGQFIQSVRIHIDDGEEKILLKSVLGRFLGVEGKPEYQATVEALTQKYDVPKKLITGLEKYAKTKSGDDLIKTFYLMQKGKPFASLQREFKYMHMDDWIVLQEFVPSTCKYKKFYKKPNHLT